MNLNRTYKALQNVVGSGLLISMLENSFDHSDNCGTIDENMDSFVLGVLLGCWDGYYIVFITKSLQGNHDSFY